MPVTDLERIHPRDCPSWEYADHEDHESVLARETRRVLALLRGGKLNTIQSATDSRSVHRELFRALTPIECPYYAGHYRGEEFRCLRNMAVRVRGDPRVGAPPRSVPSLVSEQAELIRATLAGLDEGHALPDSHLSREQKLIYTVVAACRCFEVFLRIHPYANGNGHAARFVVWALLGRYDYWPARWPIEPRPDDPPYTELIVSYRDGDRVPLEKWILECIAGD